MRSLLNETLFLVRTFRKSQIQLQTTFRLSFLGLCTTRATGHWGFEPGEHNVRHTHAESGTSPPPHAYSRSDIFACGRHLCVFNADTIWRAVWIVILEYGINSRQSKKQDIRLWFAVICPRRSRQLNTYSKMSIASHKIARVNSS